MSTKIIYYDLVSMDPLGIMGVSEDMKKEGVLAIDMCIEIENQYHLRLNAF
jgi:hypothetical protein